jgi:hypothetical protein
VRLSRKSGTWFLEFTRLVPVDEQLMRPERRRVAATLDTLRTVADSCPPERLREAETLMKQADDGSEAAFELDEDGWLSAPAVTRSQVPPPRAEVATLIAELRAELTGVRALCEALSARIVSLESAEHQRRLDDARRSQDEQEPKLVAKVPSRRDVFSALRAEVPSDTRAPTGTSPTVAATPFTPGPPGVAATQAVSAALAAPNPAAAATPGVSKAPAAPAEAPAATEKSPDATPSLVLPRTVEVLECLQMLAADVALEPYAAEPPHDLSEVFLARFVDETQLEVGALLIDRRAGAALGGGLLGLPWSARELQAERGLEQDTLEALNEISNNLGGVMNRVNPKCYTRLGALERGPSAPPAWFASVPRRLGLATAKGGRVWLLAR